MNRCHAARIELKNGGLGEGRWAEILYAAAGEPPAGYRWVLRVGDALHPQLRLCSEPYPPITHLSVPLDEVRI